MVLKAIKHNIDSFISDFHQINASRKIILNSFSEYILDKIKLNKQINLTFICTHNSRRSQMCQVWAKSAAEYFELKNIFCFSGGTEVTVFNYRAVKALSRFGFIIDKINNSKNPKYSVKYSEEKNPIEAFSKVYNSKFNPQKDYIAVMTCSEAEKNCPVVFGAEKRFSIRYNDPKESDGTNVEEREYFERCREIAMEMVYVFKAVKEG